MHEEDIAIVTCRKCSDKHQAGYQLSSFPINIFHGVTGKILEQLFAAGTHVNQDGRRSLLSSLGILVVEVAELYQTVIVVRMFIPIISVALRLETPFFFNRSSCLI